MSVNIKINNNFIRFGIKIKFDAEAIYYKKMILKMLSNLFSKSEHDLDGVQFKSEFEKATDKVLLDVRTPAEFQSGHLPKSVNVDFMGADFKNKVEKLDKTKTYFVYCRSGNRSGQAVSLMNKLGLKAFNLVGGMGSWPN